MTPCQHSNNQTLYDAVCFCSDWLVPIDIYFHLKTHASKKTLLHLSGSDLRSATQLERRFEKFLPGCCIKIGRLCLKVKEPAGAGLQWGSRDWVSRIGVEHDKEVEEKTTIRKINRISIFGMGPDGLYALSNPNNWLKTSFSYYMGLGKNLLLSKDQPTLEQTKNSPKTYTKPKLTKLLFLLGPCKNFTKVSTPMVACSCLERLRISQGCFKCCRWKQKGGDQQLASCCCCCWCRCCYY